MIRAENIYKSYGNISVLKGVNFNAEEHEIVSIVGASGAGKSTLLQVLGTLLKPDIGQVFLDDINISVLNGKAMAELRNKKIGFVFQFHHLLPEFSALENVMIPAFIGKTGAEKEIKNRATQLLETLGLGERIHHRPSELSGGEQQRVAIARALINSPSVIFADEPSGNLDSKTKNEIHDLFFKLRDEYRQTIVIVTHDKELAARSDRMLEMKDGQFIRF